MKKKIWILFFYCFINVLISIINLPIISFAHNYNSLYETIEDFRKELNQIKNPKIGYSAIHFYYYDLHAKSIYLKSDFDNWYYRYSFKKSIKNNVWRGLWILELPFEEESFRLKKGIYHYKLVIDGAFIYDRFNPFKKIDAFGNHVSYFHINQDLIHFNQLEVNPIQNSGDPNLFRFIYKGSKEEQVYILGNFNEWNSFSHPMEYKGDGIWELSIRLPRGDYYYQFFVEDEFRKDILNPLKSEKYPNFSFFKVH